MEPAPDGSTVILLRQCQKDNSGGTQLIREVLAITAKQALEQRLLLSAQSTTFRWMAMNRMDTRLKSDHSAVLGEKFQDFDPFEVG